MSEHATVRPAAVAERRRVYPGSGQVVLRGGIVLGVAVALASAHEAGADVPVWIPLLLVALAVLHAARPDSAAGIAALVGSSYVWIGGATPRSPLLLLAAAGLVLSHVCALVAAQGPLLARPDPVQVRLWAARGLALWSAGAGVWLIERVVAGHDGGRWVYAAGLLALSALAVATTVSLVVRRP